MAIYHLHVDMVKRSSGRSSVAAAAYRAAEKLRSENDGMTHDYSQKSSAVNAAAYRSGENLQDEQHSATHDYTRKRGVVHTEILLPENAPREFQDRATLWNAVEKAEKRKDAQTARDIDMALPVELNRQEQIELVREYVKENFVDRGMCADFAIHDKGDGNPHAHVLLTTREVSAASFGKKNREWNSTAQLKSWRENWANACNERLQAKGHGERIDHRTLKAQGIDREPTIHVGVSAKHMERRGQTHARASRNREIIARNESRNLENTARHIHELKENHFALDKEISSLEEETSAARREMNSFRHKAEEISERAENIENMKDRIEALKADRRTRPQAQQLERSHEQATSHFKRMYKFEPEQAAAEVARLETAMQSKQHLQDRLQEKLTPLEGEKEAVRFEYQRQRLLLEIRPDQQKIYNRLAELEKESRLNNQSTRDNLAWLRCQRTLDTITQRDFEEIVRMAKPEQAQAMLEWREREREYERLREFQRGR